MHIAIVRLSAMGDVIHTLVAAQFIKQAFPTSTITWFVEESFSPILAHNPDIDRIIALPMRRLKRSIRPLSEIARRIKNGGAFDCVIDAQGLIKSAIVAKIAGSNSKTPMIAGLDVHSAKEPIASFLYTHRYRIACEEIAPVRFCRLIAHALKIDITPTNLLHKRPYLFFDPTEIYGPLDAFFMPDRTNLLIVTAASGAHKRYPPSLWIKLLRMLPNTNPLLLAGSPQERHEATSIAQATHARLLPPLSLNQLKYVVSRATLLIGNDTGPSHMAWAMNRPSILLFGATPTQMMFQTAQNIAISAKQTLKNPCRFDKKDRSIATIAPHRIAQAAQPWLTT